MSDVPVIGRCAGCGCYIQTANPWHARPEADANGELYPAQCGPVEPVTVEDIEDLVDEHNLARAQAEIAEKNLERFQRDYAALEKELAREKLKIKRLREDHAALELLYAEATDAPPGRSTRTSGRVRRPRRSWPRLTQRYAPSARASSPANG